MVKYLDELVEGKKEIIRALKTRPSRGITLGQLREKIERETGEDIRERDLSKYLSGLIADGYVRYRLREKEDGTEERVLYLSKGIGAGYRAQKKLSGQFSFIYDLAKMYRRLFASIFILFGIGLLVYQNSSLSGAVIANNSIIKGIGAVFSLSLIIGGALILFKSFKK